MSDLPGLRQGTEQGGKGKPDFKTMLGPAGTTTAKYEKLSKLGSGSFGEAWLVRRVSDKQNFVAKTLDMSAMSKKDFKYVEAEIQCLASCNHFGIVKYHEDFVEDTTMLIIMEFADAGDLNMQIKNRANEGMRYFEEHEVAYTFVQLCMAVDHVHRHKMLHRDIKGANVLLMTNGLIKLGDFGFSQMYEQTVSEAVASTFCGTPYYLAPELWKKQKYSKKADVWAMGILLYEMMSLQRPFSGQGIKPLMNNILAGVYSPLPSKYSAELQDVVRAILVPDPNQRPGTAELFAMPIIQKYLYDFERSVAMSSLVPTETKQLIEQNLQEIRESNPNDPELGTSTLGPVGEVQLSITYEGPVRKESGKVWKERYLMLGNGELTICLKKGDTSQSAKLSIADVASVVPTPFHVAKAEGVFCINTLEEKIVLMQAPSKAESFQWIHQIQRAMGVTA